MIFIIKMWEAMEKHLNYIKIIFFLKIRHLIRSLLSAFFESNIVCYFLQFIASF